MKSETPQIILEVSDSGIPALKAFQRIIVTVLQKISINHSLLNEIKLKNYYFGTYYA